MKLLAWDTSSKSGALAALEWDPQSKLGWSAVRVVAEWTLNVEATHSEKLLWAVDQMLKAANWNLEDVDVFGVGLGPGSFTGLRIGITTARTLAHSLSKPLVGVSSLAALARPLAAVSDPKKTLIVASTDACKGELFALWGLAGATLDCAARADGDYPGLWKRGVEEQVLSPDELVSAIQKKLRASKALQWVAVGEGRARYADAWKRLPQARRLELPALFSDTVQPRAIGQLAWEAFQQGIGRDALTVHPRYLRASDAELKLKRGELRASPVE